MVYSEPQTVLTFRNCGVTKRTVAMKQTCSSSDDCRLLGNVTSCPLQEDVGTVWEAAQIFFMSPLFSLNVIKSVIFLNLFLRKYSYHCYETWNLQQTWHIRTQEAPWGPCYLWQDDSRIQYVPHLKKQTFSWLKAWRTWGFIQIWRFSFFGIRLLTQGGWKLMQQQFSHKIPFRNNQACVSNIAKCEKAQSEWVLVKASLSGSIM